MFHEQMVAISPQTGEIISMVGGSDFSKSQFNRAVQSNRQPGSAFKPLIFAAGLENGFSPASILHCLILHKLLVVWMIV